MANEKLPVPSSLVDQAAALLSLFGGTKSTSNAGDISALQTTLAGLQGQDYTAMLQAIFNKAGGQIPGIQQALGNSMGARSGGNSAVAAALQKLLADTTTNAADQVAKLQSQNMQTQANVAANIAQATAGTTKTTGTNVAKGATTGATLLALLQAAKSLGITDAVKGVFGTNSGTAAQATQAMYGPPAPTMTVPAPASDPSSTPNASNAVTIDWAALTGDSGVPTSAPTPSVPLLPEDETGYSYQDYTPAPAPFTAGGYDDIFAEFADGGLVTAKKAKGYADGGTVRASSSRGIASPVPAPAPTPSTASVGSNLLLPAIQPSQLLPVSAYLATDATPSTAFNMDAGTGSSTGSAGSTGRGGGMSVGNTIGTIGALNSVSGLTGGPAFGNGAMQGLGMIGGLANATTGADALSAIGKGVLGAASPAAGAIYGLTANPSMTAAANLGMSMASPGYGLASALSSLFGLASPAEAMANIAESFNPRSHMTAEQQAILAIEAANPGSAGLTAQANAMSGDALDGLLGLTDAFGTAASADAGVSASEGASEGASDSGDGSAGDALANGGPIKGKGTGISDSIPVRVSAGEFIISADVVNALGEDFFNQLQAAFHTPAAVQRALQ